MNYKELLVKEKLPEHIAIIMDGNGRWAKQRGNQRIFGHRNAVTSVSETTEAAAELGIKYLTLYAFSTENWSRPQLEVTALMSLLASTIKQETPNMLKNNVRLQTIGDIQALPANVRKELDATMKKTAENTGLKLILALSYSARWELINAMKQIAKDAKDNKIAPDSIHETLVNSYLETKDIPDPDLMIRTSGEYRISNFLLWQLAYSELYFTSKLWPDFRKNDLYEAIYNYQQRERRFGKTSEQLK